MGRSQARSHRCGALSAGVKLSTLKHQIGQTNGAAMAQKVQTLFIDDLDGSEADGTVRIGLDGTDYEIDLNAEHTRQLRDALARYISAARWAGGSIRSRPAAPARPRRPDPTALKSASGPRPRASRSKTASGYPPNWWSSSRRQPDSEI